MNGKVMTGRGVDHNCRMLLTIERQIGFNERQVRGRDYLSISSIVDAFYRSYVTQHK